MSPRAHLVLVTRVDDAAPRDVAAGSEHRQCACCAALVWASRASVASALPLVCSQCFTGAVELVRRARKGLAAHA
jgi:hypothetical protein